MHSQLLRRIPATQLIAAPPKESQQRTFPMKRNDKLDLISYLDAISQAGFTTPQDTQFAKFGESTNARVLECLNRKIWGSKIPPRSQSVLCVKSVGNFSKEMKEHNEQTRNHSRFFIAYWSTTAIPNHEHATRALHCG